MGKAKKQPDIHLNLNVRALRPSATLAINEHSNELIRQGKPVYKLGLGQSPFPVPAIVTQALKDHAEEKDYLPVKGLWPLREAIAHFNHREYDIPSRPEDILIGPGSKELIFLLQLVYYGELIIPAPGWVSYSPQAQIVGRMVSMLPTRREDRWQLTAEQLEFHCRIDPSRPRVLILNYPSNPTGCTYSNQRLKELAAVAKKYKVILISDEIYGHLHYEGKHVSIAHYYPEGTIISSGLSKWCGAGGWRLGTFSFPESLHWLRDAMAIVASETFTSTSAPIQYAAIKAFEGDASIDEYLHHSRRVLKNLGDGLIERLQAMKAKGLRPDGAFYLFPDFEAYRDKLHARDIYTSVELCNVLLDEANIAMLPGHDFGRSPDEFTVRMAFVDFDGARALALSKGHAGDLGPGFLQQAAPRLAEAFDRLHGWFRAL